MDTTSQPATDWKQSPLQTARTLDSHLNAALTALQVAHQILRNQEDLHEYFAKGDAEQLTQHASEVADYAETVKRLI